MFQSKIHIDLPSREMFRDKTVGEWFGSLFGSRPNLRTGKEVMTVSAYAILEGIVSAFESAGMTNVISLMVDNRTVFLDTQNVENDLHHMHHAARKSGALARRFREMHIAFTHHEQGMHIILDLALKPQVLLGDEELTITLSGRLEKLQRKKREKPNRYRSRLRSFAKDTSNFDEPREILDQITDKLAMALRSTLPGARNLSTETSQLQLIRPNAKQMSRMRNLKFGNEAPRYRPAPARYREGVVHDPFYHYYYDPFHDFALFVLAGAAIDFAWNMSYAYFVDPYGQMLGYANDIVYDDWTNDWDAYDTLHFADDGSLYVDDSIPAFDFEGDYHDHLAYDAGWDMEPADVYDPVGGTFNDAGWDTEPVAYADLDYDTGFANDGYHDTNDASFASDNTGYDDFGGGDDFGGSDDFGGGNDFGGGDFFDSSMDDFGADFSDSSWDSDSDW